MALDRGDRSTSAPTAAPSGSDQESYFGILASTLVHVAAIGSLSLLLVPQSETPPTPVIDSGWDSEVSVESPAKDVVSIDNKEEGATAVTAPLAFTRVSPIAELKMPFTVRPAHTPGPFIEADNLLESVTTSTGTGTGDSGLGEGGGQQGGAEEFFPIDEKQGRYVFVVDSSKSMNHKYPGPAKSRLGRVKIELWRSVYRMSPEQKFFIVFFNTRAIPMPSERLATGGKEGQGDLINWTARIRADGKTDPEDALLLAVRLRPDVIYFLTDGEFNYRAVRKVTELNPGISIHTIALGDNSGEKFLQEIAERNGGSYRFIDSTTDHYWTEEESAETSAAPTATVSSLSDDS